MSISECAGKCGTCIASCPGGCDCLTRPNCNLCPGGTMCVETQQCQTHKGVCISNCSLGCCCKFLQSQQPSELPQPTGTQQLSISSVAQTASDMMSFMTQMMPMLIFVLVFAAIAKSFRS